MSIYASIGGLDEDEECGAPWLYRGSHILPAEDGPRAGGGISLAEISSHIARVGRDDQPEDTPWPWLRVSMDHPDVLISPAQARHFAAELTDWANRADPPPAPPEGCLVDSHDGVPCDTPNCGKEPDPA